MENFTEVLKCSFLNSKTVSQQSFQHKIELLLSLVGMLKIGCMGNEVRKFTTTISYMTMWQYCLGPKKLSD